MFNYDVTLFGYFFSTVNEIIIFIVGIEALIQNFCKEACFYCARYVNLFQVNLHYYWMCPREASTIRQKELRFRLLTS